MKKKKNSTFTIIVFIVIIGLLALCVYGILAGLGITNSDDKEPSATTAPTVSSSAVKEDDSDDSTTDSSDSAKKEDADSSESKTETENDSQKDGKTGGSDHSGAAQPKPKQRAGSDATPAPAKENSGSLSDREATGEDNVISFDDLQ